MKFLKKRIIWTYGELGILKICMISCGALLGIYFQSALAGFFNPLLAVFVITGILCTLLYIGKTKP
jgi:hypothetical protein